MTIFIVPLMGFAIGAFLGYFFVSPSSIPSLFLNYAAVFILSCIDAVLQCIKDNISDSFNFRKFFSGFLCYAALAALFVFIDSLQSVRLYIIPVIIYGLRIFKNFDFIRIFLLNKS